MKSILYSLSVILALTSCSKDDDTSPATDSFMKASVEGKQLDVSGPGSPTDQKGCTSIFDTSDNTLYLYGNNGIVFINIAIGDFPKTTGEYVLGDVESGKVGNYADNTDAAKPVNYYSTSGKIVITGYDKGWVEGTFDFKAFNTTLKKEVTVSAGQFKIPFTEI